MKSILVPTLSLALSLVLTTGCKSSDSPQAEAPTPQTTVNEPANAPAPTPAPVDEELKLKKDYDGKNLFLAHNSETNHGLIEIEGSDAEKMFQTLRVKLREVVWNNWSIKEGPGIKCDKFKSNDRHACMITINYRTGEVVENESYQDDGTVPRLSESYNGDAIFLNTDDEPSFLFLEGDDARALYGAMEDVEIEAFDSQPKLKQKRGKHVLCSEITYPANNQLYRCDVRFGAESGGLYLPRF